MILLCSAKERKLCDLLEKSVSQDESFKSLKDKDLFTKLHRRPLRHWVFIKALSKELDAENIKYSNVPIGEVDWDAIARFFTAIAPIIIEIILMLIENQPQAPTVA